MCGTFQNIDVFKNIPRAANANVRNGSRHGGRMEARMGARMEECKRASQQSEVRKQEWKEIVTVFPYGL